MDPVCKGIGCYLSASTGGRLVEPQDANGGGRTDAGAADAARQFERVALEHDLIGRRSHLNKKKSDGQPESHGRQRRRKKIE